MEEIELLKKVSILKDLTDKQIQMFLSCARKVHFQKGETILREGEEGDTMYIVLQGTVEVSKSLTMRVEGMGNKPEKALSRIHAEDHTSFGEMALLDERIRSASITCLTDCTFYEIRREDFLQLAEKDFEIGYRIIKNLAELLCSRLRKATEDTIKLTTALSIALSR